MSDIGLIMNAVLGLLLLGALFLGWRLEGRLKVLRASHDSFTRAVGDLDRAAARAEQGLSDLRAATDEAADTLAARIERAGHLAGRLEQLTAEAMLAEARLVSAPRHAPAAQPAPRTAAPQAAPAPQPVPVAQAPQSPPQRAAASRDTSFARFAERYGARPPHSPSVLAEAAARNDLILEDDEAPMTLSARQMAPEVIARMERLRALARPPGQVATSKPILIRAADDELFDAPEPRRAAGGYR
jgi:hypothetical protein